MSHTHTLQMVDTYSQTFVPLFPLIFFPSSKLLSVPPSLSFPPSLYSLFPHPSLFSPSLTFPDIYTLLPPPISLPLPRHPPIPPLSLPHPCPRSSSLCSLSSLPLIPS